MRNLIKKILLETFHTKRIFIEEITFDELKKYFVLSEGKCTELCDMNQFNAANRRIKSYYDDIGSYKYKKSRFTITQTDHYCCRFRRAFESNNPNIHNPTTFEGIDLLISAIPDIYEKIVNNNWKNKDKICFNIKTDSTLPDGSIVPMTIAISVMKDYSGNGKYRITLVTQIKGEELSDENYKHCGKYEI